MSTHTEPTEIGDMHAYTIPRFLRHYPKSFLKLILVGFLLAALPLIFALIYSAVSIDRLANQSRETVYQAEQIAHGSRVLVNEIAEMERSVRLSLILGDASLLEGYFQAHTKFENTAENLATLSLSADQKLLLNSLHGSETTIFQRIAGARKTPKELNKWVDEFVPLLDSARNFLAQGFVPIEREVNAMQEQAAQARQIVVWQLLALIPFAVLLALGFSVLIARPLRQIDEAIRHMGQGELTHTVTVDGPQDLRQLGVRLDWMRRRLLELEEQKTRFLQHISHELKTPLTSIREGADLLAEGVIGELNLEQKHVAKILLGNSVQLQARIEDLLSYSALQTEKPIFVGHRVKLRHVLEDVVQDQQLAIRSKGLQVDLACPDLTIECDEQKIRTIVDNILSNAVKFSPLNGRIKIRACQVIGHIQLDIIDAGPGVAPVDLDKIFDAFYQGQRTPQGHIKGTGLGLSIAREYALEHGGLIEIVEHSDTGAHFRLTLPAEHSRVPHA
jgi:two-component system sensor histidine kinase GlrK